MCYPPTDENVAVARSAAPAPARLAFARRGLLLPLKGVYIDSSASRRYRRRGDDRGDDGDGREREAVLPEVALLRWREEGDEEPETRESGRCRHEVAAPLELLGSEKRKAAYHRRCEGAQRVAMITLSPSDDMGSMRLAFFDKELTSQF